MNEVKITFSVSGYVTQTVELKPGVDPADLEQKLRSGVAATTIQEDGEVVVVESGEVLGTVTNVDNNCEYDDYDVETE